MIYALYSTSCLASRGSSNGAQWEAYVLPWKDNIQDNTLLMPTPPHAPAPSHAYTFTQTQLHTHTHTHSWQWLVIMYKLSVLKKKTVAAGETGHCFCKARLTSKMQQVVVTFCPMLYSSMNKIMLLQSQHFHCEAPRQLKSSM